MTYCPYTGGTSLTLLVCNLYPQHKEKFLNMEAGSSPEINNKKWNA
jgi:hypothetical protein